MDARFELLDSLLLDNSLNSVKITNESGTKFLNIKLAIFTGPVTNPPIAPEKKQRVKENYREVEYDKELFPVKSAGKISVRKKTLDENDGSSILSVTLDVTPKVPHTGG